MSQESIAPIGSSDSEAALLEEGARKDLNAALKDSLPALTHYQASPCVIANGLVVAAREGEQRKIIVFGTPEGFEGKVVEVQGQAVLLCDADKPNTAALRKHIPHLRPILTGTTSSLGLGDRLGLATPGHIAAGKGCGSILVLSQQSIREMTRTERTAQQVMDEAIFGIFECGYDAGFGSDADHLKSRADVDVTVAAGFTFFTIDPSDHVDDSVEGASIEELRTAFDKLITDNVPGATDWKARYIDQTLTAGSLEVPFSEEVLLKAAVKYGRAVAHSVSLGKYIAQEAPLYELELSVDETALPTSPAEHLFIAHELKENGVELISLAPRFIGEFEKGIDYKGDLDAFEKSLADHVEIAKHYGPYKISVHSGSDKFQIYPIVAKVTDGLFHLKTAGTSYLEAIRVVARHDVPMFKEIITFSRGRFETDKATYHISSTLEKVPLVEDLAEGDLERVYLDEDDGRQILHVTFGSVLTAKDGEGKDAKPLFRHRLLSLLNKQAPTYVEVLEYHIGKHVTGLH